MKCLIPVVFFINLSSSCGTSLQSTSTQFSVKSECIKQTPAYADTVIQAAQSSGVGFGDPHRAVNGVRGAGARSGSLDVFSLDRAQDGVLIIGWNTKIVCNQSGADINIFENGFLSNGGESVFFEPIVVSVSLDGKDYEDFPHTYLGTDSPADAAKSSNWQGFAGMTPVYYNEETNNYAVHGINPLDPSKAGGDVFDLDHLPDTAIGKTLKIEGFRYLKFTAAPKLGYPNVPSSFDGYADIDGVYAESFAADQE
jgi:hypothetical protein